MSLYFRDSHAAILVFDYSQRDSLESLTYWLDELNDRIDVNDVVIKIAGNKYDLYETLENKIEAKDIKEVLK